MFLFNSFLLVPVLVGAVFCVAGLLLYLFPPKKINLFYGYRTPRSLKSEEAWHFAQRYAAKELLRWGGLCIALSVLGIAFRENEDLANVVSLILIIGFVILIFVRTERQLIKKIGSKIRRDDFLSIRVRGSNTCSWFA